MACPSCSSPDLVGGRYVTFATPCTATLPCCCGRATDGIAALHTYTVTLTYQEWGPVDEDGRWRPEHYEEIDCTEDDEDLEVYGQDCLAEAGEFDWELEAGSSQEAPEDYEEFLSCPACGHEEPVV